MCEQIVRLGIGLGELLAFHTAVCEKAEIHNISRESAAYRVIEDIRDYDKLGGMKKQLNVISMQIFMMNQYLGRQNHAVNALMKLQSVGVTDKEILNIYEFLNSARFQSAKTTMDHNNRPG